MSDENSNENQTTTEAPARTEQRAESKRTAPNSIEQLTQLVGSMVQLQTMQMLAAQQQQQPQPQPAAPAQPAPIAAAPQAPNGPVLPDRYFGEAENIFNWPVDRIRNTDPHKLRLEFDKIVDHAIRASGAPRSPKLPGRVVEEVISRRRGR